MEGNVPTGALRCPTSLVGHPLGVGSGVRPAGGISGEPFNPWQERAQAVGGASRFRLLCRPAATAVGSFDGRRARVAHALRTDSRDVPSAKAARTRPQSAPASRRCTDAKEARAGRRLVSREWGGSGLVAHAANAMRTRGAWTAFDVRPERAAKRVGTGVHAEVRSPTASPVLPAPKPCRCLGEPGGAGGHARNPSYTCELRPTAM